ncbi:DNA repair protein REV1 isoform X2 [Macrosteles quadrilineatus]|uniref:DNA repair protein REV1 isoform X2 n=1 Tax=Macrosteles quadrilineatus TaxID=74068 RepID=UPI0023E125CD|nr:DNA repair protein REV1 isoform X2 [Macrosteles quadrilineatus]
MQGGYMAAKKAKLQEQFMIDASKEPLNDNTKIFNGISIFVNGYTVPSADELKLLMMKHGGIYHHYFRSDRTTHVIATNLPDTKVKHLKNMNVVKPDWIVDSIAAGKVLDYCQYLLYSHQSKTQPKLTFKNVDTSRGKTGLDTGAEIDTKDNSSDFKSRGKTFTELSTGTEIDTKDNSSDSDYNHSMEPTENVDDDVQQNSPLDNNIPNEAKPRLISEVEAVPGTSKTSAIKTASEAGFLSEFYCNSRLHHISTMGATFKQYVNELRLKNSGSLPGLTKLKSLNCSNSYKKSTKRYSSVIMHIDMDCFFVSVGLRKRPDLKTFPVAVTHAKGEKSGFQRNGVDRKAEFELYKTRKEEKAKNISHKVNNADVQPWSDWVESIEESDSMSEIASCNYEARKMGLKNGMFLGQALKLCPSLKTIPYDFDGYKEVSYCLYNTVASYTLDIEAVSCDEMFVDCTSLLNETCLSPLQLASLIREEIKEKTGCPCSAGFGANRLQARLATKRAKPDGQFYLEPFDVQAFMDNISVSDLPGVGRSTSYKLSSMGIKKCSDLQQIPLTRLQAEFGVKSGESLYKHCRGEDHRKLVFDQIRKSVSAEVNYGIRFQEAKEADQFLRELSKEVHNRLLEVNMKTKLITLKLMTRAADAPVETAKFLGHGVCDHVSRSSALLTATDDLDVITREVLALSHQLKADPIELRGIGIQLSKLESTKLSKPSGNAIVKFLRPKSEINQTKETITLVRNQAIKTSNSQEASSSLAIDKFFTVKKHATNQDKDKPKTSERVRPMDVEKEVLEALPEEIRKEVMMEYGLSVNDSHYEEIDSKSRTEETKTVVKTVSEDEFEFISGRFDLGPNYSQIDLDVLAELPKEIKREIEYAIPKKSKKTPDPHKDKYLPFSEDHTDEVKLDQKLSPKEVRSVITAWTTAEDTPQPCDVDMLSKYLKGLITSHQLDHLDVSVSCLHRCIEKRNSQLWQDIYHNMINELQLAMVAEYGLRLRVPNTFRPL